MKSGLVARGLKDAAKLTSVPRGASQVSIASYYEIGVRHYHGTGVAQDCTETANWFRKAADLGAMYYGAEGMVQDFAQAVHWFRKAAEQGDARARFNLGCACESGQGLT